MPPVTIHQPAPCHENWEAMTPTEVGRHCAACQTEVVDFTQMTDGEVVAFLRHTVPGRRCGMFREDQVGRPLVAVARPVTGFRRWGVAGVLLLGALFGLKARAQGLGQNPVPDNRTVKPVTGKSATSAIPDSLFLVQGVVRNRWGVRQEGAKVRVGGSEDTTDSRGYFGVLISQRKREASRVVVASYWTSRDVHLWRKVPFDPNRAKLYHIRLRKAPPIRAPGFY